MHGQTFTSGSPNPTVRLCGDSLSQQCGCRRFEDYGAVFEIPLRLEILSDVILAVEWCGASCRCHSVRLAGIVVGCTETEDGFFETSVIFLPGSGACEGTEFRHLAN